ncbi:hypothetical protein ABZX40_34790 [Streptomyces sp. NPDC004610]|uniref:hypothetical protein n=1 Tax=unclassified Streptomyces TaxID=2593676 RepID=UPI0033B812D7
MGHRGGGAPAASGWCPQDIVDEFPDPATPDPATPDPATPDPATPEPQLLAPLVGELHGLPSLALDDGDDALAAAELSAWRSPALTTPTAATPGGVASGRIGGNAERRVRSGWDSRRCIS